MKNVLFVDDEPKILSGIKRMLRCQRHEWGMFFANGGPEALGMIAEREFDVIVTDMRMPGMDGAELLTRVQECSPSTVRIVLSGHTELEAALRALPVAHQFLNKPCQSNKIKEVIDRACNLQALFSSGAVRKIVSCIDQIPGRPEVYNELTVALQSLDVTTDTLVAIVERDASLCAKLLQVVNSGFFGLGQRIAGLGTAINYLGVNLIRNLSLSVGVNQQIGSAPMPDSFSMIEEQDRALLTAKVAQSIVADRDLADEAFMAGILLDIGKTIVACQLPEEYEKIGSLCRDTGRQFFEAETEIFSANHGEIGGYLLGIWGLPYPIVEAVAYHHSPSRVEAGEFDLLGAAHVASAMVDHHVQGNTKLDAAEDCEFLDQEFIARLGVGDKIPEWWESTVVSFQS